MLDVHLNLRYNINIVKIKQLLAQTFGQRKSREVYHKPKEVRKCQLD